MRKSIGLYADTRNFKTTLPQTKHLNFFMQTNPQGYANGGQVRAGIPQSNMKVTSGFLPMALGYDSGGEGFSFAKLYEAATIVAAQYLNLAIGDPKVKLVADQIMNTEEGQELAKKLLQRASTRDVETEVKAQEGALNVPTQTFDGSTTPSNRQPQFNIPQPVVSEPITTRSDRQGAFDNVPMQPLPKISTEQQQREYEDSQKSIEPKPQMTPPGDGGITSITPSDRQPGIGISNEMKPKKELPFYLRPLDINKDGKITMDDYNAAMEQGLPKRILDAILRFLGQIPQEDNKQDDGGITTIKPEGPNVDVETEIKESEKESEDDNKIIKPKLKIKPEPDNKISTGTGRGEGALEYARRKTDLSKKDAKDVSTDLANLTGNEGKKDIPEWALPLASAGFAMMASKSPNFLQALGEAGQAGIATLSAQREAAEAKLDKEAERKYRNAMADFYEKGGSQSKGGLQAIGGKLYYKNTGEPYMIGAGDNQIHAKVELTRTDAIEILGKDYPGFLDIPNDDPRKEEIIQGYLNLVNGGNAALGQKVQNETTTESEQKWWQNLFNLPKIDQYLEDAAKG